mgnify:CR=1 FL=1
MRRFSGIAILILGIIFFGCKTEMMITETSDNLSEALENPIAVQNKIVRNNISDTTVTLKNFKINYSSNQVTHNLYGAAKLVQDSAILVSLRAPLGIEISRVLFKPQEVLVLDRKGNRYLVGDYSYLQDRFGLDLNFNLVNSLLLGNFPSDYQFFQRRKPFISGGSTTSPDSLYVGDFFHSVKKNYKFQLWVHSSLIRPERFLFYKKRNFKAFSVQYFDYVKYSRFYLPDKLQINGGSEGEKYKIGIDYRKIELSSDKQINFNVPSKFKKIRLQ